MAAPACGRVRVLAGISPRRLVIRPGYACIPGPAVAMAVDVAAVSCPCVIAPNGPPRPGIKPEGNVLEVFVPVLALVV